MKKLQRLLAQSRSRRSTPQVGEPEWRKKIESLGYIEAAGGYERFRGALVNESHVEYLLRNPGIPRGTIAEVIQLLGPPLEGVDAVLSDSVTPDPSKPMVARHTVITKLTDSRTESKTDDSAIDALNIPLFELATFGLFYRLTPPQGGPPPQVNSASG